MGFIYLVSFFLPKKVNHTLQGFAHLATDSGPSIINSQTPSIYIPDTGGMGS